VQSFVKFGDQGTVPMSHTSNPSLLYIVDATLNMNF